MREDGLIQMTKQKMPLKAWLPLIGMTVSAFIFNTSEFMPIGLLSDIAANFGITESHAGLLISVYSWVVTLLSLPLMLLVSKMSYRKLLLGTIALFGIFQVLSGVSASYGMLMVSRIGVACTHAIFWSVASPIAVRLVPEEHQTLAMSMIVTGTSVAMIFGLPLGRVIGLTVGWRMTFLCVAAVEMITAMIFPDLYDDSEDVEIKAIPEEWEEQLSEHPEWLTEFLQACAAETDSMAVVSHLWTEPPEQQLQQAAEQVFYLYAKDFLRKQIWEAAEWLLPDFETISSS